jgi:hypothetical protein
VIPAVEDLVSAAAAEKVIRAVRPHEPIQAVVGLRGKEYLKGRARELNRAAVSVAVLMLVDLDTPEYCPPALVHQWFGTKQPNLSFRVAVMEVEAWPLADRETHRRAARIAD